MSVNGYMYWLHVWMHSVQKRGKGGAPFRKHRPSPGVLLVGLTGFEPATP